MQIYNASDKNDVREQKDFENDCMLEYRNDLATMLKSKSGRHVLWTVMTRAGIYRNSCTGNGWTFYYEGERSQGLRLLKDIEDVDQENLFTMMRESREKEISYERKRESRRKYKGKSNPARSN
jgi:hypothetical protein